MSWAASDESNNTDKLPREEASLLFRMDQFFLCLINYSKILSQFFCWYRKVRSLVFIFEHREAKIYFSLQLLFFHASNKVPEILCLLKFSSKISIIYSCLLYLIILYYPYLTFRFSRLDVLYIHNVFTPSLRNTNSFPSFQFVVTLHFLTACSS